MKKIYIFKAGKTLDAHEKIVKKLEKRGATVVEKPGDSVETVLFCPIVSRYETDINSALSSASEKGCKKIILVAMHHTFDEDYTLPSHREMENDDVILHVDCLFFETKGLLKCSCNDRAFEAVYKQLGLKKKRDIKGLVARARLKRSSSSPHAEVSSGKDTEPQHCVGKCE